VSENMSQTHQMIQMFCLHSTKLIHLY